MILKQLDPSPLRATGLIVKYMTYMRANRANACMVCNKGQPASGLAFCISLVAAHVIGEAARGNEPV